MHTAFRAERNSAKVSLPCQRACEVAEFGRLAGSIQSFLPEPFGIEWYIVRRAIFLPTIPSLTHKLMAVTHVAATESSVFRFPRHMEAAEWYCGDVISATMTEGDAEKSKSIFSGGCSIPANSHSGAILLKTTSTWMPYTADNVATTGNSFIDIWGAWYSYIPASSFWLAYSPLSIQPDGGIPYASVADV
ncbi:hypothetical protein C8R44DRAFT_754403 [Mycena epipterygia]|nr:hypothetical protein C8R44DRAFT_754403 [Mycena epipterygia]